jgi:hypothetical protein
MLQALTLVLQVGRILKQKQKQKQMQGQLCIGRQMSVVCLTGSGVYLVHTLTPFESKPSLAAGSN